jgi:predicted transcriptional regulator
MVKLEDIKKMRQKLGLSQTELARRAGVTQAHIAKIESGKVDPRFSTVSKIFGCLNIEQQETCEKYMTPGIIEVSLNSSISDAAKIMRKRGISQIPVYKGKQIVGLLTERDLILNSGKENLKVKEIMEDMPPTVAKYTPVDSIRELLLEFPAVIVMDEGKAIGIITKSDLIK